MKTLLIALKQGVSNFAGGTIFMIEDCLISKDGHNDSPKNYYQIPDDCIGRVFLIDRKDAVIISENELNNTLAGQEHCSFTKEEIFHPRGERYQNDFSSRSIFLKSIENQWHLFWRLSPKDRSSKTALFINKITNESTVVEAACQPMDYEDISLNPTTYEQIIRKQNATHHFWNIHSLTPDFYKTEIDLGESFKGIIHFIKHYPQMIDVTDKRKTEEVQEVTFSQELWNTALELSIAWGPDSRIPFQVRLLDLYPKLLWAQANYLLMVVQKASSFAWSLYEKEAKNEISLTQASNEIMKEFSWVDDKRLSGLKTQGEYYAKFKG